MKRTKETSLHQIFSNIWFCLSFLFKLNRKLFTVRIISTVLLSLANFIPLIFIRLIINEITIGKNLLRTAIYICVFTAITLAVSLTNSLLSKIDSLENEKTTHKIKSFLGSLSMKIKYSDLESPRMKDFISIAESTNPFFEILAYSTGFFLALLNALGLSAIIFTIHPVVLIVMFIIVAVQIIVDKKRRNFQFYYKRERATLFRKNNYLYSLAYDTKYAKETRANEYENRIIEKVNEHFENEVMPSEIKMYRKILKFQSISESSSIIQQAVIYVYLAYRVIFRGMLIGDFSLYLASIQNFTEYISGLVGNYALLLSTGLSAQEIRYCISMSKKQDEQSNANSINIIQKEDFNIVFKNVSFKYPSTDKYILKNINITLESGKTLSLVGLNGAGKTTFVKLLCRFYDPSEGEILFNGIPINTIPYEEYIKMFSVVFQDYKLFSYSVAENIAMTDDWNENRIKESIRLAGLNDKVSSLPNGLDTYINKQFDSTGIEFSGGEGQKIAIARTVYKNAPIAILDEPTSALDPIAESEIYRSFSELSNGKCTLFISHRLSSTKFTDNVAVFSEGIIVEYGTHKELMSVDKGLYKEMYLTQSQYYLKTDIDNQK